MISNKISKETLDKRQNNKQSYKFEIMEKYSYDKQRMETVLTIFSVLWC